MLLLGFAGDQHFAFAVCSKIDVVVSIYITAGLCGTGGCSGGSLDEELGRISLSCDRWGL